MKKIFAFIAVITALLMLSSCMCLTGLIGKITSDIGESQMSAESSEQPSELPSQPPENNSPSIPESSAVIEASKPDDGKSRNMVDYIGMTVNELAEIWGNDYQITEYWETGAAKGIYYDDVRIPFMFYFIDHEHKHNSEYTGNEVIEIVQGYSVANEDYFATDDVNISLTFADLIDNIQGEYFSMWEGEEFVYRYYYDDNISVSFVWECDQYNWSDIISNIEYDGGDMPQYINDEIAEFLYDKNATAQFVEIVKINQ